MPRALVSFFSYKWKPMRKYLVSSGVLDMHWIPEFMKQVLPKFYSPQRPFAPFFVTSEPKSFAISSSIEKRP